MPATAVAVNLRANFFGDAPVDLFSDVFLYDRLIERWPTSFRIVFVFRAKYCEAAGVAVVSSSGFIICQLPCVSSLGALFAKYVVLKFVQLALPK